MNNGSNCLDSTLHLLSIIAENKIYSAFDYYFENYEKVISKAKIEWELIKKIFQLKKFKEIPLNLIEDIKQRTSGVALLFICSQLAKIDIEFFPELNRLMRVPSKLKRHLAYTWIFYPQCKCLDNHEFRRTFALWLAQYDRAVGACLLAESKRNDLMPELIDELSYRWIQKGLSDRNTPKYLSEAVKIPVLKNAGLQAVKKCIGFFFGNKEALQILIRCAFDLEDYETAVTYSEIILTPGIDEDVRKSILSLRLAALAELDKEIEVIEEYKNLWMPLNCDFPFPDRLLFIFQKNGRNDLENHLLKNCVIDDSSPSWVKFTWEYIFGRNREELLNKWSGLYDKESNDERILFGFTNLLISIPDVFRTQWIEIIKERWKFLYEYEDSGSKEIRRPYEELAGAFLVLMNKNKVELIEDFRKYLSEKMLNHPIAKRAAQAYIRALAERKRWKELRDYLDKQDIRFIRAVSPFEEYEFIKAMANLEELPNNGNHLVLWCQYWERLISLPIDTEMIKQAVEHFVNLREKLITENHAVINNYLFEDISLQILRRAKAEGERLLMNIFISDEDKKEKLFRLQKADIDNVNEIIRELFVGHGHQTN
jgi:hypothetical protein